LTTRDPSVRPYSLSSFWPVYLNATLAPGLAWQRMMLQSYRSMLFPSPRMRRLSSRRLLPYSAMPANARPTPADDRGGMLPIRTRTTPVGAAPVADPAPANNDPAEIVGILPVVEGASGTGVEATAWADELPAIGQSATTTRTFLREDVLRFAHLSGDMNPLHVNPDAWIGTPFTGNLVHGAFTASLFSQVMAMQLPGPGAVYLNQTLKFQAPVYVGETVTATVTVTQVRTDKRIVTLETRADVMRDGQPVTVLEGEAVIKLLKRSQNSEAAS
jgi:3-hydroxybutyryl-CoA dehydratase